MIGLHPSTRKFRASGAVLFFALLGCVAEVPPSGSPSSAPPNVFTCEAPYDIVWKELTHLVTFEHLLPLEVIDEKAGFMTTAFVRDQRGDLSIRYRLSARVVTDGKNVLVNLYNHPQRWDGEKWRGLPTDYLLERKIIAELSERLRAAPRRSPSP